jgi:hypothetical protein
MKMYLYKWEGPKLSKHLRAMGQSGNEGVAWRIPVVRDFAFRVLANAKSINSKRKLDGYALWVGFAAIAGTSDKGLLNRKFYRNWVLPLESLTMKQLVATQAPKVIW